MVVSFLKMLLCMWIFYYFHPRYKIILTSHVYLPEVLFSQLSKYKNTLLSSINCKIVISRLNSTIQQLKILIFQ